MGKTMRSRTMRYIVFALAIFLLAFLLLACDDPMDKRYHIRIVKSWFYCDDYEWLPDNELEMVGCAGHSGTVTKKVESRKDVLIVEYIVE